jgi:hypothetical protein
MIKIALDPLRKCRVSTGIAKVKNCQLGVQSQSFSADENEHMSSPTYHFRCNQNQNPSRRGRIRLVDFEYLQPTGRIGWSPSDKGTRYRYHD